MPRHPLPPDQRVTLGIVHIQTLDQIATGKGTAETMWDWVSNALMWSRAAELMHAGEAELQEQLELCLRLIDRFQRTGRVAFDGPDYQLAKRGVQVMDELAELVNARTALKAARWSETMLRTLRAAAPANERSAA